jgi:hypothetical protein
MPLVTISTAVMTIVHFTKVNTMYPWVVISSLAKRLEKPPFCHSLHFLWRMAHRSLHVVTKVHYGSYAKLRQGSTQYHNIAKVSRGSHSITAPLAPCEPEWVTTPTSHTSEQGTLPTTPLIIKQAIPYPMSSFLMVGIRAMFFRLPYGTTRRLSSLG